MTDCVEPLSDGVMDPTASATPRHLYFFFQVVSECFLRECCGCNFFLIQATKIGEQNKLGIKPVMFSHRFGS